MCFLFSIQCAFSKKKNDKLARIFIKVKTKTISILRIFKKIFHVFFAMGNNKRLNTKEIYFIFSTKLLKFYYSCCIISFFYSIVPILFSSFESFLLLCLRFFYVCVISLDNKTFLCTISIYKEKNYFYVT